MIEAVTEVAGILPLEAAHAKEDAPPKKNVLPVDKECQEIEEAGEDDPENWAIPDQVLPEDAAHMEPDVVVRAYSSLTLLCTGWPAFVLFLSLSTLYPICRRTSTSS